MAMTLTRPAVPVRPDQGWALVLLALGLLAVAATSLQVGATGVSPLALLERSLTPRDRLILWDIRLPRLVLGGLVGAGLAVSGAILQGLFRNPLADPGLVGVGAGAGLGAVLAIVLGGLLPLALREGLGLWLVPLAACGGGWLVTLLLYRLARQGGGTSVAVLLLAGIGIGALAGALTGVILFLADDAQLRDLTFWSLGSLSGASWPRVAAVGPLLIAALVLAPGLARGLNGLSLGEAAAMHLGIGVEGLKTRAILLVAAATGAAVAVAGGIGFVGIVVPHLIRLVLGPDHRLVLPGSALLGATVLMLADLIARSVVAPAELPVGVVTALMGAPVFLWVLLARRDLAGV